MIDINKQELREAAENATPGEWCADDMFGVVADAGLNGNFYIATCSGPDNRDNKRFIAVANPATVLALLDELEDYKAAYEEYARDKEVQRAVIDDALCKLLPGTQYMDPPDGGSVTPLEQVRRMVAYYRERIAELEQRHHIKPCPKCNDTGMADSGGTQPWGEPIEIECDCRQQDANTAELEAAGIITKVGE